MLLLTTSPESVGGSATPRGEGPTLPGLAAAAKKQQAHHGLARIAGACDRATPLPDRVAKREPSYPEVSWIRRPRRSASPGSR